MTAHHYRLNDDDTREEICHEAAEQALKPVMFDAGTVYADCAGMDFQELQVEVGRLRAALQEIVDMCEDCPESYSVTVHELTVTDVLEAARAALGACECEEASQ